MKVSRDAMKAYQDIELILETIENPMDAMVIIAELLTEQGIAFFLHDENPFGLGISDTAIKEAKEQVWEVAQRIKSTLQREFGKEINDEKLSGYLFFAANFMQVQAMAVAFKMTSEPSSIIN